jgi:hypothetical protein
MSVSRCVFVLGNLRRLTDRIETQGWKDEAVGNGREAEHGGADGWDCLR